MVIMVDGGKVDGADDGSDDDGIYDDTHPTTYHNANQPRLKNVC